MDLHQAFLEHRALAAREALLQGELTKALATVAKSEADLAQVRSELRSLEVGLEKRFNGSQKTKVGIDASLPNGESSLAELARAWIGKRKGREWSLSDLVDAIGVGTGYAPKLVHRLMGDGKVQRIRRGVYRAA